jgi:hypothetical protein
MKAEFAPTAQSAAFVRANPYYQSLILHNNAGPLGTAASLPSPKGRRYPA